MEYENGNYYEGAWKDGAYHGKGVFYESLLGVRSKGSWVEGKKHGIFKETLKNGAVITGTYDLGQ